MERLTQMWNDYETFASAGGPARWVWTLAIGFTALIAVVAGLKGFARFAGRSIATGYREERQRQRDELNARLAVDIHRVVDGAQLDGDQQR